MMEPLTVEERVQNGARFLDQVAPGWETRIDLETLELAEGSTCICGQVFEGESVHKSGYSHAFDNLFGPDNLRSQGAMWVDAVIREQGGSPDSRQKVAATLGFDIDDDLEDDTRDGFSFTTDDLQVAWVELISKRMADRGWVHVG